MPALTRAAVVVAGCLLAQAASADGFLRDILSSGATTASTYLTFKDRKIVAAGQEDASSFIASNGAIRGAHLEAALNDLRSRHPQLQQVSDLDLAQAILTQTQAAN